MSYKSVIITAIILLVLVTISCAESIPQNIIGQELVNEIELLVTEGNIPSLQASVVHEDKIVWSHTFGVNTSNEYLYMNASVQKVFDATAILQLYEKGIIDIDADINSFLPFEIRHPDFMEIPITIRMILSHRSGLENFRWQFGWDTECLFSPEYRQDCDSDISILSLGEYLAASLVPDGINFSTEVWKAKPGTEYYYSVSTFPLLKFIIERVTGLRYPAYMKENILIPLEMKSSGFTLSEYEDRHAIPHTRIDGRNVPLEKWNGNGYMMRTTAEDMGKFMIAHMNNGRYKNFQLLKPSTIELMRSATTKRKSLFNWNSNLAGADHGLGLHYYSDGWFGYGGSTVGYQTYWRYNIDTKKGYTIIINVNGILGGKENHKSVNSSFTPIKKLLENELGSDFRFILYIVLVCLIVISATRIIFYFRRRIKG